MKISKKLLIYFLIVLIVPIAILSFVLLRNSQINLEEQIMAKLEIAANDRKTYIEEFFKVRAEMAQIIAERTVLKERFAQYNNAPTSEMQDVLGSMLNDSLRSLKDGISISLIDLSGITIASSDRSMVGMDNSQEVFFENGVEQVEAHVDNRNGNTELCFISPIFVEGKIIGLVRIMLDPESLKRIIEDRTGLGDTGEIILAMKEGEGRKYLFERRFEDQAISQSYEGVDIAAPMKAALAGQEISFSDTLDYRGVRVKAVARYIEDVGIGLVAKIDSSESNAPLKNNEITTIVVALFSILMAALVAIATAKSIANPLQKLAAMAKDISEGGLLEKIILDESEKESEIGLLADAFNKMIVSLSEDQVELKRYAGDLENVVSKKTKELQKQNNYLEVAQKATLNVVEDMKESGRKLQEQNKYLEDARKAVVNILEDVAQSEHDLSHKTTELEKFQQAADASFDHIVITDLDGTILYMNNAAEEITGYSKEESIGKNSGKLWGGQMPPEVYAKMWQTIREDKSPYAGEITNKHKSGNKYLASIRISPILDKKNEIKFYVGVERDITEEREAQMQVIRHATELQKANIAIEKQKENAESILRFLKSIGDGVVATDMKGKIIFFNKAAEELTGVASEKAMGQKAAEVLAIFGEKNPKKQIDVMGEAIECGGELCKTHDRFVIAQKDGSQVDISFSTAMIYNKQKKEQGCILSMHDVRVERELEKTKDNFLSVAAHQLRTPLSGIRWSLEMLLGDDVGKLPEEAHEVVENINENTMRLITLVNDLLNVSRINMGKVIEPASPVNIMETISAVLKSGEGFVAKNKVKIVFDGEKYAKLKTLISPQHFFESIENIVSNAIKYTPEQGTIRISIAQKSDKVRIAIADSGIGIPKEEQGKIFSKFFRAQNAIQKDPDGSGLGLNVVKSFIEEAGGSVSFESVEGKGTTFFIDLPIYKEGK